MAKWGEVISVTQYPKPLEGGEIGFFYRYLIKTAKGARIAVEIPEVLNTPEEATKILQSRAAEQDRILSL